MAKEPSQPLVGKTKAAVQAGDKVGVEIYSHDPDPDARVSTGQVMEVPSNLDVPADRWCVINDFRGVPTVCAADQTPDEVANG